jgi:hypothetical protein
VTRTQCGGCGSGNLEQFLDLGTTPLADNFPISPNVEEKRYPLRAAVCTSCWLVQLLDVVPDAELWTADYGFYSSTSPSIRDYDKAFADWAKNRFAEEAKHGVIEIACNDGSLLQHFKDYPSLGIEPSAGPAKAAEDRGLTVVQEPFTLDFAQGISGAGLVIAKNVAAHVVDLNDFFAGIAHLIGDKGVAIVEVQNVADLLLGNQIDHFYHEHRYYFSADSLRKAAARAGLLRCQWSHTPAQGGSIRMTLTCEKPTGRSAVTRDSEPLSQWNTYASMQARAEMLRSRLRRVMQDERDAGRVVAGYAASAKSTTLLNWCDLGREFLTWVEDTTPAKIGRYTPGTHIPIHGPGVRPDTYLLLAWNYLSDVLRREKDFDGRWIVPIPAPVVI